MKRNIFIISMLLSLSSMASLFDGLLMHEDQIHDLTSTIYRLNFQTFTGTSTYGVYLCFDPTTTSCTIADLVCYPSLPTYSVSGTTGYGTPFSTALSSPTGANNYYITGTGLYNYALKAGYTSSTYTNIQSFGIYDFFNTPGGTTLPTCATVTGASNTFTTTSTPSAQTLTALGTPPETALGWFPLDESAGSTAYNFANSSANGTWTGPNYLANATSGIAKKYTGNFANSSSAADYITVSGISVPGTTGGTLAVWVNPSTTTNWLIPIGWKNGSGYVMFDQGGSAAWRAVFNPDGGAESTVTGPSIVTGAWHHLAMTWSYSSPTYTVTLYYDGVSQGSTTSTRTMAALGSFMIGGVPPYSNGNMYIGYLSNVRVYNSALSANKISAIYNAEKL